MNAKGFAALSAVLVIMAILSLVLVVGVTLSIGSGRSGLELASSERALALTEGCVEDALRRLRADATYTGGALVFPEGECSVDVATDGSSYDLSVSAERDGYRRTVGITARRDLTKLVVVRWQEIP